MGTWAPRPPGPRVGHHLFIPFTVTSWGDSAQLWGQSAGTHLGAKFDPGLSRYRPGPRFEGRQGGAGRLRGPRPPASPAPRGGDHDPKINDATQEPVNCTNYTAYVQCFPAPNIICKDFGGNETHFTGSEVGFFKPISCRNVNGYSYKVAVALSLFLGWLGADRFYLGYPALGLLKFCTVGFCGIGSLIDFILISMQIVGPSDGRKHSHIHEYCLKETDLGLLDFNRELSIYKTSDFYFFKYHFMDSF
ncbi:hypothetical protein AB1E18_002039 [Capra hircus]